MMMMVLLLLLVLAARLGKRASKKMRRQTHAVLVLPVISPRHGPANVVVVAPPGPVRVVRVDKGHRVRRRPDRARRPRGEGRRVRHGTSTRVHHQWGDENVGFYYIKPEGTTGKSILTLRCSNSVSPGIG